MWMKFKRLPLWMMVLLVAVAGLYLVDWRRATGR
jgi:hypothetical protein